MIHNSGDIQSYYWGRGQFGVAIAIMADTIDNGGDGRDIHIRHDSYEGYIARWLVWSDAGKFLGAVDWPIDPEYKTTELWECSHCKRWSTPFRVKHRPEFIHRKFDYECPLLCTPCRNKLYPLRKKEMDSHRTKTLINRIAKELRNGRQHQDRNNGATSPILGQHDGGREERAA